MKHQSDILIRNIEIFTQDSARKILQNKDIAIKNGKIIAIGNLSKENWTSTTVIDGTGKTIFPGMQNLHVHIFQSILKGLGADLNLIDWVKAAPMKGGPLINGKIYSLACQLAFMESLKCGVTTIADFNYLQHCPDIPYTSISMAEQFGIREIYMDVFHDTGMNMGVCPEFIYPPKECIRHTAKLIKEYKNDQHPLIQVWPGASVPWGTSRMLFQEMSDFSKSISSPWTMHILETEEDNIYSNKEFKKSIIEAMEEMEVLSDRLLAVHCVCLKEGEMKKFEKYGVNTVYCPAANAYLGSGIAPISLMKRAHINITMGTDGAASNNSSDMIESMKLGLLLQKAEQKDPTALKAQDMLDFVTVNAARATKRNDLGSIEIGKTADLFIYNPLFVRSTPNYNSMVTLMYNSSPENVETTIVNGRIVYHKGNFACGLEEDKVVMEINSAMKKFMKEM